MATLFDMHAHVEAVRDDDQAPEQDVTDDAEDTVSDHIDEAPEHDVTSAHETAGTTIIELSPADDVDSLEEDVREEEEEEEEEGEEGDEKDLTKWWDHTTRRAMLPTLSKWPSKFRWMSRMNSQMRHRWLYLCFPYDLFLV